MPSTMAGSANERRERLIVEAFLTLLPESAGLSARLVQMRDKPDAEIELESGQRVGVEVTELFDSDDGRDRHLESIASPCVLDACRELLGPHGDVDVRRVARPADRHQVERWISAFRAWLLEHRDLILEEEGTGSASFPIHLGMLRATLEITKALGEDEESIGAASRRVDQAADLAWLRVDAIQLAGTGGWIPCARPGGDDLADRHDDDVDDMIVDCVRVKCRKAAAYSFEGPLWCVVRKPFRAEPSSAVERRLAELPDIARFDQVWLINLVINVTDGAQPPTFRRLR